MKATSSGIAIALALALLAPANVVGQEASPSAGPSASPAASAEPSPATVVLRTFYDLLDNDRDTPTAKAFRRGIEQAYGDEPDAAAEAFLREEDALACIKTIGESPECDLLVSFWYTYRVTGDEAFFDVAVDAFNYGTEKLYGSGPAAKEQVREQLRTALGEAGPIPPAPAADTEREPSPAPASPPATVLEDADVVTPAPVDLSKYTVAALLSKKATKISKPAFRKVVDANVKAMATYMRLNGSPDTSAGDLRKRLMGIWTYEKPGQRTNNGTGFEIGSQLLFYLEKAQQAARRNDAESANAFMGVVRALRRLEESITPPPSRKRDALDRWIRESADARGLR